jgi:hypothetical protein
MTESEWLACQSPESLIRCLDYRMGRPDKGHGTAYRRRVQFNAACCRRIWDLLVEKRSQRMVELAEQFVDGLATLADVASQKREAEIVEHLGWPDQVQRSAARAVLEITEPDDRTALRCAGARARDTYHTPPFDAESAEQCRIFRDIFRAPFRRQRSRFEPAWCTALTHRLAESAYHDWKVPTGTLDPGCLAVLADALEEVGCADPAILGHLRSPEPHVRGCWVVDGIRRKC